MEAVILVITPAPSVLICVFLYFLFLSRGPEEESALSYTGDLEDKKIKT